MSRNRHLSNTGNNKHGNNNIENKIRNVKEYTIHK